MKTPEPLRKNSEFKRAYSKGKSIVGPLVIVYARKNRLGVTRLGITTSKKIGNAVTRSRARRVIREGYRPLADRVLPGYDLVLVARGRTAKAKSTALRAALEKQLRQAGLLKGEAP